MKKQSSLLLISMLAALFIVSCSKKTIKIQEKDISEKHYLSSDTTKGALALELEIELPIDYKNKETLQSIRNLLITKLFGEDFLKYPTDSVVEFFKISLINEYYNNNKPLLEKLDVSSSYSFDNVYNLSGFGLLSDKHIFVYGIERYEFMGGAHGIESRNYYNFDLKTGKLITEDDLFIPNYKDSLTQLIKNRIVEESRENNDKEPIFNLNTTEYWTDSIKPNSNFYITDLGLKYVFNPYEIAPYNVGLTEIFFSFKYIRSILKPENPISYLILNSEKE